MLQTHSIALFDWTTDPATRVITYTTTVGNLGIKPPRTVPSEIGITHRSGVVSRFIFNCFHDGDAVYSAPLGVNKLRITL